jgi:hypothetical protein
MKKFLMSCVERELHAKGPAALVLHRSGPTSPLHLSLAILSAARGKLLAGNIIITSFSGKTHEKCTKAL